MNYHNITYPDQNNGDGLRVVLWVSGCSHHCKNCQNPQTWNPENGIIFDANAEKEILNELGHTYISGITFSGGDPLFETNREELTAFVREIKTRYPDKTIWLYTGYQWEQIQKLELIQYLDVLVDGRFVEELKDNALPWKGSENQRVIDVQMTRKLGKVVLYA